MDTKTREQCNTKVLEDREAVENLKEINIDEAIIWKFFLLCSMMTEY